MNNKRLGSQGENIVRAHLVRLGWRILESNFRCSSGEMDLIAEEQGASPVLVFVEVKTRRDHSHGGPIEAVDTRKQRRLAEVARAYLGRRGGGGEEPECRFDVAEVEIGADGLASVTLRRAAFASSQG